MQMSDQKKPMRNLTPQYSLITALYWSNFAVLSNYAGVYLLGYGFSNTGIGLMIAIASLLAALVQPFLGSYADKPDSLSVKVILLILTGLFLASAILIPLSSDNSPFILSTAYTLALMLMQSMMPLINAFGPLSADAGYHVNFGLARGIGSLLYAITSLLIGLVSLRCGINTIPFVSVVIYVLLGVSLLCFPFRKSFVSVSDASKIGFLKKYPRYLIILAAAVCLYSSHVLIANFTYQIILTKGGDSVSLGIAYAIAAISELPMMFCFSRLMKRISAGKCLVVSGFAFLVKCVSTMLVGNPAGFYFIQTLQMLAYAGITVASVYYIDGIMEPEDAVKGQAFFTMTNMIGSVFASALGGWFLDKSGVTLLLSAASVFAGAGTILMCYGVRKP